VVARHRFDDGFSDDIIAALASSARPFATKLIILLDAGVPTQQEVRQISLGADCVLRNPIRTDVLIAYIDKYLKAPPSPTATQGRSEPLTIEFCGSLFAPLDRTLQYGQKRISLTPREAMLIEMLTQSPGDVATYEQLYGEILGRNFRGETSNMRVLLGKLATSCRSIGLSIRPHIQVIPKTGYRYDGRQSVSAGAIARR
jgi:DNA-binding response OmpR family regulator